MYAISSVNGPLAPTAVSHSEALPDWLETDFFKRISLESKQLIATKTANIRVTASQITSLKERKFDTDPFFKTPDWIYVGLKAFAEGAIDVYEISDLVLYDGCSKWESFHCYTADTPIKWDDALRGGFGGWRDIGEKTMRLNDSSFEINWEKDIQTLQEILPPEDAHIYSYRRPFRGHPDDFAYSPEHMFYRVLQKQVGVIPMIGIKDKKEIEALVIPPRAFQQLLACRVGQNQAIKPIPVLGFCSTDGVINPNERIMSIQHPEFAVITGELHTFSNFDKRSQVVWMHDMYHLIVGSAFPYRTISIDLATKYLPTFIDRLPSSVTKESFLEAIQIVFLDQEFSPYLDPRTQGIETFFSYGEARLQFELQKNNSVGDCNEINSFAADVFSGILGHMRKQIAESHPAYNCLSRSDKTLINGQC